jgi:hypothetical protein
MVATRDLDDLIPAHNPDKQIFSNPKKPGLSKKLNFVMVGEATLAPACIPDHIFPWAIEKLYN